MTRALRWAWSMMRNESVSPRTLFGTWRLDEGDSDWEFAYRKLIRLQKYVFELHAKRTNTLIEVSGNVASEQIKDVVEEVFRDYDPDAKLSNLITVTAPFRSAEDDDDYAELKGKIVMDSAIAVKTVPVDRYPAFTFEEMPSVGERFRFEVDLSGAANSREPIRFDLPSGWTIIAVDVDVISAQLRFEEGANRRKRRYKGNLQLHGPLQRGGRWLFQGCRTDTDSTSDDCEHRRRKRHFALSCRVSSGLDDQDFQRRRQGVVDMDHGCSQSAGTRQKLAAGDRFPRRYRNLRDRPAEAMPDAHSRSSRRPPARYW
jgi:hypothetical protein